MSSKENLENLVRSDGLKAEPPDRKEQPKGVRDISIFRNDSASRSTH